MSRPTNVSPISTFNPAYVAAFSKVVAVDKSGIGDV